MEYKQRQGGHPEDVSNHGALISNPPVHLAGAVHAVMRCSAIVAVVVGHIACAYVRQVMCKTGDSSHRHR
jgi:hypothetical protein